MQMAKAGLQQGDPMRGQGPRRGLTPFDKANMEGAAMQAGIINFLGGQPEVTAPIRAQSHADAPPTELAYITAAEKQMLLDANLHGSLEGREPNPGPAGIQSLDDWYNYTDSSGQTQVGGGSGEQVSASGVDSGSSNNNNNHGSGGYQSSEDFYASQVAQDPSFADNNQNLLGTDSSITTTNGQEDPSMPIDWEPFGDGKEEKNKNKNKQKFLQNQIDAEKKLIADGKGDKNRLKNLVKRLQEMPKTNIGTTLIDKGKEVSEDILEELKKMGLIGKEIKDIDDLPKDTQKEMMRLLGDFKRLEVSPKEAFNYMGTTMKSMSDGEFRDDEYGNDTKDLTLQGLTKRLRALDTGGGASVLESLKKYNPELYYDKFRVGQTSGALKDFSMNKTVDTSGMDRKSEEYQKSKRYNNAIFDARDKSRDGQGDNNQQGGRPAFIQDIMTDEVIDTPAGVVNEASNTMEYSGPSTGSTTQTVPLNKRFTTDPTTGQYTNQPRSADDIYKYYSQGTSGPGNMMEPWEEYQKRRRKALGLAPLGLYTG